MELYTDVVAQYDDFAGHAADSPCFASWAAAITGDAEVQQWIAGLPPIKQQPNLVFAAARWHGVPAPGPYDGLRRALLDDDGSIRATILARATQTNEVGRLATLTPWFDQLGRREGGRPLALLEAGASAGLCLHPDRYSYRWTTDDGVHETGRGPLLSCAVTGTLPDPPAVPEVAWRGGIDLAPPDVTDEEAMAWLRTLVWPEHEERRERLRTAVEVARADPPRVVTGDLLELLPDLVEEAAAYGPVVVFHSAVVAYLEPPDRERFRRMMEAMVAAGRCHWLSNEAPRVLPSIAETRPAPRGGQAFVLGLDGRAVAWTHGHGASMQVL